MRFTFEEDLFDWSDVILKGGLQEIREFLGQIKLQKTKFVLEKEMCFLLDKEYSNNLMYYCIKDSRIEQKNQREIFKVNDCYKEVREQKSLHLFQLEKDYSIDEVGISSTFLLAIMKLGFYHDLEAEDKIVKEYIISPFHKICLCSFND